MGTVCEEPQKLVCGQDQILKLDAKPNGCRTYICECKPADECEKVDLLSDKPLEPGYIREIDDNGKLIIIIIKFWYRGFYSTVDIFQYHRF